MGAELDHLVEWLLHAHRAKRVSVLQRPARVGIRWVTFRVEPVAGDAGELPEDLDAADDRQGAD